MASKTVGVRFHGPFGDRWVRAEVVTQSNENPHTDSGRATLVRLPSGEYWVDSSNDMRTAGVGYPYDYRSAEWMDEAAAIAAGYRIA